MMDAERMLEKIHAQGAGSYFKGFNPKDWEFGRYGDILRMIREGAGNKAIMKKYPGVDGELVRLYRRIAAGRLPRYEGLGKHINGHRNAASQDRRRRMMTLRENGWTEEEIAEEMHVAAKTVKESVGELKWERKR